MEEEKKLYPMKFCALQDDYDWGSEIFRLTDLGYKDSFVKEGWLASNTIGEVMDTYMDRVVGDNVHERFGRQFPVCVKHIKAHGRMPLQVHPDDVTAGERYDFLGKEKLWYVLRAGRGAALSIGFKQDTDASALYAGCLDGSVYDLLNTIAPHEGQCFHVAPGVPHCLDGDVEVLEVSESSPLDFCLCGWGKTVSTDEFDPSLSLVDALDFIDYRHYTDDSQAPAKVNDAVSRLFSFPQFELGRMELKAPLRINAGTESAFTLYICVSGSAALSVEVLGRKASFAVASGETMLVPAECPEFEIAPTASGTVLLEVTVPFATERDQYIDPSVSAEIPDQE